MDLQTRKIQFIPKFLKCADANILAKFEEMLKQKEIRYLVYGNYKIVQFD